MKKTKVPSIVTVLILTLITLVMWVMFDLYRVFYKVQTPSVPEAVSQQLTPTLDQDAINQIEGRTFLDDSQIPEIVVNPSVVSVSQPSETPVPAATSSPVPEQ